MLDFDCFTPFSSNWEDDYAITLNDFSIDVHDISRFGENFEIFDLQCRILEKPSSGIASTASTARDALEAIAVDENYIPGELRFVRRPYKSKAQRDKEAREKDNGGAMKPFGGEGNTIRPTRGGQ
ncbi:hypothetical protein niasHT_034602 [Heterodera trifolii]|uniref:Uncharacterized protein n=1 Tax=Heterodera trifolii TaxID=157864 RepID=A0ABD2IIT4_9BILA